MGLCCVGTGWCAGHRAPSGQDAAVASESGGEAHAGHMTWSHAGCMVWSHDMITCRSHGLVTCRSHDMVTMWYDHISVM